MRLGMESGGGREEGFCLVLFMLFEVVFWVVG